MEGTIFSIEEFSVFDGPGIRTSVFLKGCPLRCQWCHNPEGQQFSPELFRSVNGCLHCGKCMEAGRNASGKAQLTPDSIAVCPKNLIRICGEKITPQQLCKRLESKLPMLSAAGGGVTFSGGEPLAQPSFLLECLDLLSGITHRAVQTSGFAPEAVWENVLKRCEYVLFDLKLMDPQLHKIYTGVDNHRILDNYRTLVSSGVDFITRIPLIPGVNDTAENLSQTAQFLQHLGVTKIELLPYNKAAGAKYAAVNKQYDISFDPTAVPEPRETIFRSYGIEVHIL